MRSNAYLQSHACIRKTLQRRNKPARRRQVFYKVANSKIYLPRNQQLSYEPALELENMIFFFFGTKKNLPCFLWLSFQEKLASNTLDWKLVLGTSGGSSIRHLGRDQVLRLWLCLKLNAGICFPGGRDCSVNLMKSGSPEPHRACWAIQRGLARRGNGSGLVLPSHSPQPFIGPLPAGPKARSAIPASFV